jgi:hypothetical protein
VRQDAAPLSLLPREDVGHPFFCAERVPLVFAA